MNSWAIAVVLIVAIGAITSTIRARMNAQNGYVSDRHGNPVGNAQREKELEREVEELRERIHVLERIATSDRDAKQIAAEIEQLRDK
ncbi:MAG: hypothetical protein H6918_05750 [Sphingomonadaceae bacterium]|nr:hypothetical protein [Sphingomonadaceae bacterium]